MATVEVSGAPGEIVITEKKIVDATPATEPRENSVPAEDSAAKETPTEEKLGAEGAPDQPHEEKPNGAEETLIKEIGETAAREGTPSNETVEVKEETPDVAAAEVTDEPKDLFVVKESEAEVEPSAIVEPPPAKEGDLEVEPAATVEVPPSKQDYPEASEEPSVKKMDPVSNGENEKAVEVDGAVAAAAEAAE